jgi:predicted transcriptional regulator
MSDSRGYSTALVQKVAAANPSLPTIRLARVCIDRGVSVWEVSRMLGVSRPIIYRWFSGKTNPRTKHVEKILILVYQLESA